jgi:hypothetical protein
MTHFHNDVIAEIIAVDDIPTTEDYVIKWSQLVGTQLSHDIRKVIKVNHCKIKLLPGEYIVLEHVFEYVIAKVSPIVVPCNQDSHVNIQQLLTIVKDNNILIHSRFKYEYDFTVCFLKMKNNSILEYLMPKTFNYIGSKLKLLNFLTTNIEEYTDKKCIELDSFGDYFSGTGVVGRHFASKGCRKIISNDIQHYGYVVSSVMTTADMDIDKVKQEVVNLNAIMENIKDTTCANSTHFVYNTYTEGCSEVKRMYLTALNGLKVDVVRQHIDKLLNEGTITDKEWRCLLKVLLYAVTKVSNVASVYGAYLKQYKKCAVNNIVLDVDVIDDLLQY